MTEEATAVRFAPWIGTHYVEGFRGLRVLIVCESHYGGKRHERPTVTPEIIKALALGRKHPRARKKLGRHPHFAKIMASVSNARCSASFTSAQRAEFWDRVAYYNFLQEFLKDSRVEPDVGAWARGRQAFVEVLSALGPELILCFSARNGVRVRSLAGDVPVAVVNHPSSRFAYRRVNPVIAAKIEAALERKSRGLAPEFVDGPRFRKWRNATEFAAPAHGSHLSQDDMAVVLADWKELMESIDRCLWRGAGTAVSDRACEP